MTENKSSSAFHSSMGILLLMLFGLIIFGQTLTFSFIEYDDPINIIENQRISNPSIENFLGIWQKPQFRLYIPVTYSIWMALSFISLSTLQTIAPVFFHAVNVLFHLLNAILIFLILKDLICPADSSEDHKDADTAAFFGALFFLAHPVQVEPVAWVTGFKDLSYTFFSLATIRTYLHYRVGTIGVDSERSRIRKYLVATLFFSLALLCKPTAVIVPIVILLLHFGIIQKYPDRNDLITIGLWLLLAFATMAFTITEQASGHYLPLFDRIAIAIDTVSFYFYKLFFPFFPSMDYGRTIESVIEGQWSDFTTFFTVALIVFLSLLKNRRLWLTAFGLFIIGFAPVSGLLPFDHQRISTVADRYLYFSIFGPAIAIGFIVHRYQSSKILIGGIILVLLAFGASSFHYAWQWQNTEKIMTHTLDKNPRSTIAHNNLGVVQMKKGLYSNAICHFQQVLSIDPDDELAHYNLALTYALNHEDRKAESHREKLLEMDSIYGKRLDRIFQIIDRTLQDGRTSENFSH